MISLLMAVFFLHIVGMLVHKKVYVQGDDWRNSYVDWFTVITALFIFQIDQLILNRDPLWLKTRFVSVICLSTVYANKEDRS
ncbi:hypothetical protein KHA80_00240 [Anaerobacillus sp. HL2]|nr:hypothetical protein KHA80_00240 [Anaerobacillus sp. HL2]